MIIIYQEFKIVLVIYILIWTLGDQKSTLDIHNYEFILRKWPEIDEDTIADLGEQKRQ